jgi:hypothetical protein
MHYLVQPKANLVTILVHPEILTTLCVRELLYIIMIETVYPSTPLTWKGGQCDNSSIMGSRSTTSPITDALRRAIAESGLSYKSLSRETGVARASIQRFIDGRQSLRLDKADRLAAYFGLEVRIKS